MNPHGEGPSDPRGDRFWTLQRLCAAEEMLNDLELDWRKRMAAWLAEYRRWQREMRRGDGA